MENLYNRNRLQIPFLKLEIIGFYQPEGRSGALRFESIAVYHVYWFSVSSVR